MIRLESALAQEIVERTMKIVPYNINVMDAHGVILGSGDPARRGELHAGARMALAQVRKVEIETAMAPGLETAQPGVNIPLFARGQLCGVVGISGKPRAVRQVGELVRVMAEMILEQAQLVGELQHEKRYRESFVEQWVGGEASAQADLELWGNRLGIDFTALRSALVLELDIDAGNPESAMLELQRCQQRVTDHDPSLLTAIVSPRELVIFTELASTAESKELPAQVRTKLSALDGVMGSEWKIPAALAIGAAMTGLEGARVSYQSAKRTLQVGRLRYADSRLFSYYELSFPVLLGGLADGWQARQLRQPLRRLQESEWRGNGLQTTINTWFAENCNAELTAKQLHIHRNTLNYRLHRIGEITGLDLTRMDDRLLLYLSLQIG